MPDSSTPLADRLRPQTLDDFVGQEHLVGQEGIIRALITSDQIPSMIFWGPPGCGKTSLAEVIAATTKSHFVAKSAVTTTLKEVRQAVAAAGERLKLYRQKTIYFLDEIHRFNKAQQDAFLPHVEAGTIILIGATTENPSFEVIGPLLSRSRVFVLNQLTPDNLRAIIRKALKTLKAQISPPALDFLVEAANGDARIALNALEIAANLASSFPKDLHPEVDTSPRRAKTSKSPKAPNKISLKAIADVFQRQSLLYDRGGEEHYNTISSYLKSMRASNVDAALYYLARMVAAGQDPLYIARRMVVFASEDVASPTALVVANAVFQACQQIGYPECQENLAAGTVYLATAKKDRSAYDAYMGALEDVKKFGNLPIPLQIRNAPTKLMKELGYGKGYEPYTKESLLPEKIKGKKYYFNERKG